MIRSSIKIEKTGISSYRDRSPGFRCGLGCRKCYVVNQQTAKTEIACYGPASASRVRVRTVKTVT